MQEYQITALQQQLQTVKDLKREYEAAHASFAKLVPEVAQLRGNDHGCAAPSDLAAQPRHAGGTAAIDNVAIKAPGAQVSGSVGRDSAVQDGLITAMTRQLENLGVTATREQTAAFVLATELDRRDACAVLTGKQSRYYVHQSTVSVGRNSVYKGKVDIDLTLEGAETNISRYTCFIDLDLSYGFVLHNIGKQTLSVNNIVVPVGHKIKLPHLSLLEVGGISLLFQVNPEAIVRLCLRPPPCPA